MCACKFAATQCLAAWAHSHGMRSGVRHDLIEATRIAFPIDSWTHVVGNREVASLAS